MNDAVAATRDNAAEDDRPVRPRPGPRPSRPAGSCAAGETDLVVRWLTVHAMKQNGLLAQSEATIQQYMEQKILEFYGLR